MRGMTEVNVNNVLSSSFNPHCCHCERERSNLGFNATYKEHEGLGCFARARNDENYEI